MGRSVVGCSATPGQRRRVRRSSTDSGVIPMVRRFKDSDKGKQVMTADGDMVGTVEQISGNDAHVKPDAGLSKNTRERLGWTKQGEDTYRLKHSSVKDISGDEIHLKSNL